MKILNTLNESIHTLKLKGVDDLKIKNAFFANYLAGLLMLRVGDMKGLRMINDAAHIDQKRKFSAPMSDINFWGRAMFYPDSPELKNLLSVGSEEKLVKASKKVIADRVVKLFKIPSTNPEHIHWKDTCAMLALFKHTFGLKSSYFDHILNAILKWDTLGAAGRHKAFGDALMYLMQSDASAKLLQRLRVLHNKWMVRPVEAPKYKFKKEKLKEDGAASGTGGIASSGGGGGNAIITPSSFSNAGQSACDSKIDLGGLFRLKKKSPNQVDKKSTDRLIRDNKIIKMRQKKFKAIKWKAPDFMKKAKVITPGGEPGMKKIEDKNA